MRHIFCRFGIHYWTIWESLDEKPAMISECEWCKRVRFIGRYYPESEAPKSKEPR